jgi:hypothetical protein
VRLKKTFEEEEIFLSNRFVLICSLCRANINEWWSVYT